jgi:hypothetical protein
MNLRKLPVVVKSELIRAGYARSDKTASLPVVYSTALAALEEAVEETSFEKLRACEVKIDTLATYAAAIQDTKMGAAAKRLKYNYRKAAFKMAERIKAERLAAYVRPKGQCGGTKVGVGIVPVLMDNGFTLTEAGAVRATQYVSEEEAALLPTDSAKSMIVLSKGRHGKKKRPALGPAYHDLFMRGQFKSDNIRWFRTNQARGVARQFTDKHEQKTARVRVILVRAWCDEFLKNLPKPTED